MTYQLDPVRRVGAVRIAALARTRSDVHVNRKVGHSGCFAHGLKFPVAILLCIADQVSIYALDGRPVCAQAFEEVFPGILNGFRAASQLDP